MLVLICAAALLALLGGPRPSSGADPANWSLSQLQAAIAEDQTATCAVWMALGNRLTEHRQYSHAADAFERALRKDPRLRDARVGRAIALAALADNERLMAYLRQLLLSEPKLTEDLFERPEFQPYLQRPEFRAIKDEAHLQAMD